MKTSHTFGDHLTVTKYPLGTVDPLVEGWGPYGPHVHEILQVYAACIATKVPLVGLKDHMFWPATPSSVAQVRYVPRALQSMCVPLYGVRSRIACSWAVVKFKRKIGGLHRGQPH